jgi:hypothetical protein
MAARHEAGHAIVGLALGMVPIVVYIRPSPEGRWFDGGAIFDDSRAQRVLDAVPVAGAVATRVRWLGLLDALALLRAAERSGVDPLSALQRGRREARALLLDHHAALAALAEALLANGRLARADILRLAFKASPSLRRALPRPRPRGGEAAYRLCRALLRHAALREGLRALLMPGALTSGAARC